MLSVSLRAAVSVPARGVSSAQRGRHPPCRDMAGDQASGQPDDHFLDNNVLAHEHGLQQIEEMGHADVKVDFNQGLDTRLITPEIAAMLAKLHWVKYVRLSCDTSDMLPVICAGRRLSAGSRISVHTPVVVYAGAGCRGSVSPRACLESIRHPAIRTAVPGL